MSKKRGLALVPGAILIVLGVFLLFFSSGGVIVTWETASEVDTMGFNLYRTEGATGTSATEGTFQQVNTELIPAKGDPMTGAAYQIEDANVEPGRTYSYQIEEVEWTGARRRFPEIVRVRAGVPSVWLSAEGTLLILFGCGLLYLQMRQHRRTDRDPATEQEG